MYLNSKKKRPPKPADTGFEQKKQRAQSSTTARKAIQQFKTN